MVVSKKAITKKGIITRYIFAASIVILGLTLNILNIGKTNFFSYDSVGNYMLFVGALITLITTLSIFTKKDKIIDERHERIAVGAMKYVWYFIFIGGFSIIIADGISPIKISIRHFISYAMCLIILVYAISYKILEKRS